MNTQSFGLHHSRLKISALKASSFQKGNAILEASDACFYSGHDVAHTPPLLPSPHPLALSSSRSDALPTPPAFHFPLRSRSPHSRRSPALRFFFAHRTLSPGWRGTVPAHPRARSVPRIACALFPLLPSCHRRGRWRKDLDLRPPPLPAPLDLDLSLPPLVPPPPPPPPALPPPLLWI
jgi:hypothetical protein